MTIKTFAATLVAGALSLACLQTPASAASVATNLFLNNLNPNVDFLDRSSRFALDNSKSAKVKAFAKDQAREQTLAANAVDEWIEADKRPIVVAAAAEAPLQTGRSAAVTDPRLPMGQEDLDRLEGMTGSEFDALYKEKQLDALRQVETDYADYIAKGDDPVLLSLSNRELPKVRKRIAALAKL